MTKKLQKLQKYCDKKSKTFRIQKLAFGYERAFIDFTDDQEGYDEMLRWLGRQKKLVYVAQCPYSPVHFMAFIRVMDESDRNEWLALSKQDAERAEEWWQRYHDADPETRKLMACGAII